MISITHLYIYFWSEINVDKRVQQTVNIHQLLPSRWSQLLRGVKEVSDEGPLGVLPLGLGDHVPAIEDGHIGQPGHKQHPLLLPGELVQEGTALDSQVVESGKLPQFLHFLPAVDLCCGDIETIQTCVDTFNVIRMGK